MGIRATLQVAPSALFFPKLTQAAISMGEFGWSPTSDPWIVLQSLVHTSDGRTSGVFNAVRYSNAMLDALIDAIRAEPDLLRRRELVAEAVCLMAREPPILPLYRVQQIWVAPPSVELPSSTVPGAFDTPI